MIKRDEEEDGETEEEDDYRYGDVGVRRWKRRMRRTKMQNLHHRVRNNPEGCKSLLFGPNNCV